jgi:hypothetical protein
MDVGLCSGRANLCKRKGKAYALQLQNGKERFATTNKIVVSELALKEASRRNVGDTTTNRKSKLCDYKVEGDRY